MANTKKSTKKTPKKKVTSTKTMGSPLLAAGDVLDKTLKTKDWKADLDPQSLRQSLAHLPTGSLTIDFLIGGKPNSFGVAPCPGMPRGRIMQLYGHEGSGKTTLALTLAAETCAAGGTVCYIDWENEIVPYYAKALGVPIEDSSKFLLAQPDTLEAGIVIAYTMAKHGVDLIVFDSVGAGVPKKLLEGKLEELADLGRIGLNAAIWSASLPKIKAVSMRTGTAIIGISQLRSSINTTGFGGDGSNAQGGKAWRFYSSLRMKLARIKTEKIKVQNNLTNKIEDKVVGAQIKVKLDKCKVSAQQGNEEIMYIRQGEGIDDYRTIIEVGIAYQIVKKGGAWIEWTSPDGSSNVKCQGMEKFRREMIDEPGAFQVLYEQILPYLGATTTPVEEEESDLDDPMDGEIEDLLK